MVITIIVIVIFSNSFPPSHALGDWATETASRQDSGPSAMISELV